MASFLACHHPQALNQTGQTGQGRQGRADKAGCHPKISGSTYPQTRCRPATPSDRTEYQEFPLPWLEEPHTTTSRRVAWRFSVLAPHTTTTHKRMSSPGLWGTPMCICHQPDAYFRHCLQSLGSTPYGSSDSLLTDLDIRRIPDAALIQEKATCSSVDTSQPP